MIEYEESIISSCLQSLLLQDLPAEKFEVLVIDDGSSDNTFEIASDFIDKFKYLNIKFTVIKIDHAGLSCARNTGVFNSNSEYVSFIDADAYADNKWF